MTFTDAFQSFVCVSDTITCDVDGFTITATIYSDDTPDAPDERQDGFWPSLYKDAPGFIGPGNNFRQRFDEAQAKAEKIMQAWRDDEWFYCGIVLSAHIDEIEIDKHAASLWGIEANYPDTDNAYLTQVANELLDEALESAKAAKTTMLSVRMGAERSHDTRQ